MSSGDWNECNEFFWEMVLPSFTLILSHTEVEMSSGGQTLRDEL